MKYRNLLLFLSSAALLVSCAEKELSNDDPWTPVSAENAVPDDAVAGHIRIKLDRGQDINSVDLSSLGEYTVVRTFPDAGRFEPRHHEAGLDLWYDVFFDETMPLTRAGASLDEADGIDTFEYVEPIRQNAAFTFNDPDFSKQWHYYNPGTRAGEVTGCDINLLPAWEITTGRNDVIVCVNDGGVAYTHPDLAANMWVNEAELNGTPGVDDDNNGFVDDIYGYNFLIKPGTSRPIGTLSFDDHGTHVAGTIAAVNNNGVGCCGVAGGNGSKNSGVRLMSTQTAGGSAYIAQSFTYAADNGAVVMNCSWSINGYAKSISDAIDYFNKYAGFDEHGNQVGPMAGGLAIFAAGNDAKNSCYPAQQTNVFSVAAVGADFVKAYYSNYGEWVDISAPGGDAQKGFYVYSTVPEGYATMQGTSMAAPHVTGVAALVVSRYGRVGFTRQMLIDILKNSANPKMLDYNKNYAGQLGVGLVDAGKAVSFGIDPPEKASAVSASAKANVVTLTWTVPGKSGDPAPYRFNVYYSENSFAGAKAGSLPSGVTKISLDAEDGMAVGQTISQVVEGLKFGAKYYFRIGSENILGTESELSDEITVLTKSNSKPVVEPVAGTSVTLKSFERGSISFKVSDPDGHALSYSVSDGMPGLTHTMEGGVITLDINALSATDGKTYNGTLTVTDSYDPVVTPFSYTILANHAPEVVKPIGDIVMNAKEESVSINLADYFTDEDGEELEYTSSVSGVNSTVTQSISDGVLKITGKFFGTATVNVTAVDARGENAVQKVQVLVRDGSNPFDLYPNPVKSKLNIRPGASVDNVSVKVVSATGSVFFDGTLGSGSPFSPMSVDMTDASAGIYTVVVTSGSEEYKSRVVKL